MVNFFKLTSLVNELFKVNFKTLALEAASDLTLNLCSLIFWIRQIDYTSSDQTPGPNDIKIQDYEPILFNYFNFAVCFLRAFLIPFMKSSYFKIFKRPKNSGIEYIPGIPSDALLCQIWGAYRVFKLIYQGSNLRSIFSAIAYLSQDLNFIFSTFLYCKRVRVKDFYNHTPTQLIITIIISPFMFWIFQSLVEKSDKFFRPLYDLLFNYIERSLIQSKKILRSFSKKEGSKVEPSEEQIKINPKTTHNCVKITIYTIDYLNRRVINIQRILGQFYRTLSRIYLRV